MGDRVCVALVLLMNRVGGWEWTRLNVAKKALDTHTHTYLFLINIHSHRLQIWKG